MRKNKNTETIFQNLFTSEYGLGKVDKLVLNASSEDPHLQKYLELINKIKTDLIKLGDLEEIILQFNTWYNLKPEDLSITLNNGYVYVRTAFYRNGKKQKEIRVIVGNVEKYEEANINIEDLTNIDEFNQEALEKIKKAMEDIIMDNINKFKLKNETIKIK